MRRQAGHLPLPLDICAGSDVVLTGEHKLIVQHPFRFVVKASTGVELNDLHVQQQQQQQLARVKNTLVHTYMQCT